MQELVAIGKEKDIIATKLHQEYTDSMAKLENLQAWKESLTVNQKSIDASKQKRSELKTEIQAANQEKNTVSDYFILICFILLAFANQDFAFTFYSIGRN